jgi:FlaA1/EpsC-like NDP-sugar epimerase
LKTGSDYRVRLVIDDSINIQGETLFGQRIYSFEDAVSRFKALNIDSVLLAMPSASRAQRQSIISNLVDIGINVKTIPGLASLINGSAEITELKNVAIDDLLGREPVAPDPNLMNTAIGGKVVLVTGAGGSIGSELCRQIIRWRPSRLIILDQSEYGIYLLEQEISTAAKEYDIQLTPVITSVLDSNFMLQTLGRYKVDTIYHAAAYKHVPLMEQNVMQGMKNNVFGTKTLAECAIETEVKNFILISTDKAVNPTNFMGASKRLCELLCQSLNKTTKKTNFSMVRFGNVLGSSGSVIPLFKKQIANSGPVTVTHEEVTRYFMTITEAAQLVVQAGALAKGGEVFVLDMGKPVRIINLVKKMIRLSGLAPFLEDSGDSGDVAIRVTGLRPGEKLYEELAYDNNLLATAHPRIMNAQEKAMDPVELEIRLKKLECSINQANDEGMFKIIASIVPNVRDKKQISEVAYTQVADGKELGSLDKNIEARS